MCMHTQLVWFTPLHMPAQYDATQLHYLCCQMPHRDKQDLTSQGRLAGINVPDKHNVQMVSVRVNKGKF